MDSLWFYANYSTYRQFALLTLSAMFHDKSTSIRLDLLHPASDIRHIMLEYNYRDYNDNSGWRGFYFPRPYLVRYRGWPIEEPVTFWGQNLHMEDRLTFRLTNLEDAVATEEDYEQRDTIWLDGNDRAYASFAEFLLNIGRPEEPHGMYRIEGVGDAGTFLGLWSAEARFILPGHSYWREDQWSSVNKHQA